MASSTGSPGSGTSVLRMAAPLVVSFSMRATFTLVDTVYAALLGDAAVAGIGIAIPFEFVMIAVWVGLSTGLTSCLSRAMGAREGAKIEQYKRSGWIMAWIVSPFVLLVGVWIWFLFPQGELTGDVYDSFRVYGAVLIGGSAFTSFWSVIPDSVVKAHHDTRSTMWAGIISNVLNLALNTFFLFVLEWGMFGIAFSTVLGRIGGLWYALVRARHHERLRQDAHRDGAPARDPKPFLSILALAVPASIGFALMASETAVINLLLSFLDHNTEALAAYSIYYRVVLFALNPVIAAGVALLPYTARRYGQDDIPGIRRGLRESMAASAIYSFALLAPIMLIGSDWIAARLGESPLTITYAAFALKIIPLVCFTGAPFLLCRPIFEGMQRGRPGLVIAVVRYVGLTVPLCWIGLKMADLMEVPQFYGLLLGLLVVGAIASSVFYGWLARFLRRTENDQGVSSGGMAGDSGTIVRGRLGRL